MRRLIQCKPETKEGSLKRNNRSIFIHQSKSNHHEITPFITDRSQTFFLLLKLQVLQKSALVRIEKLRTLSASSIINRQSSIIIKKRNSHENKHQSHADRVQKV